MSVRCLLAAAALAGVPAAASSAVIEFAAPAGNAPVERLATGAYDAVLPSGRIVTPNGTSVTTGIRACALALAPGARFAIAANAGAAAGQATLTVVDTATMDVTASVAAGAATAFAGVAAVRDPRQTERTLVFAALRDTGAVDVFDLDAAGKLTPDPTPVVATTPPLATMPAVEPPTTAPALTAAADGRLIYVTGAAQTGVVAIDTGARAVLATSVPVGFEPFAAAPAGSRLLVSSEGLMAYSPVAGAPLAPPFVTPPADPLRASALAFVDLTATGTFAPQTATAAPALAMDETPDGKKIIGGAHPTAIAVSPDAADAFVAMTDVDRIAIVALAGTPYVAGGTELRFFDRGPYGTQPAALALSSDGSRLYVALAGLNAVAVLDSRDPLRVHRLGLIPTGWLPTALALAPDNRTLFVLNTNGSGQAPGGAPVPASTLEKIDLGAVALGDSTRRTLKNTRDVRAETPHYPAALRDVIVIVTGGSSFDAVLGDIGAPAGDASDVRFGEAVTPNVHALARRFSLAVNAYADAPDPCLAHQWLDGGNATVYAQRAVGSGCPNERPEGYPRAGYIFNDLARHGLTFRDYGDLVRVAGYDDGAALDPDAGDSGLGGRYPVNVPAPAVLAGSIDLTYPGWQPRISSERRAREFVRDFGALAQAGAEPRFTDVWLPLSAAPSGDTTPAAEAADGDRALGTIVAFLSRLPSWKQTAIFVVSDPAGDAPDHVDARRTLALVISPYAKRHFVGEQHLSTVSVLKTVEGILDVPPLALGDLLATDMSDFFTAVPDDRPYAALAARPDAR